MSPKKTGLLSNEDGVVAIFWGLIITVVVGLVGLGLDTGYWYMRKSDLQNATDASAIAAVYKLNANPSAVAAQEMTRNGFGNATITVSTPPTSGAYSGNNQSIEVTANLPGTRFFSSVITTSAVNYMVRAVAIKRASTEACVLALNTLESGADNISGNATIDMGNCAIASNSANASGISISGSSVVTTSNLYSVGGYYVGGSATLNASNPNVTYATPVADIYAGKPEPNFSGCAGGNNLKINNGNVILSPGVYCNGLTINAQANVTFLPGTYIMDRGAFQINGSSSVNASGVTFFLTSSTDTNYATIDVNGGANVNMSASTGGAYSGMLFYGDRNAPDNVNTFNGGASGNFSGAMYFPSQTLKFNGGSAIHQQCIKLVADTINFTGNAGFTNTCPSSVDKITLPGGNASLVE